MAAMAFAPSISTPHRARSTPAARPSPDDLRSRGGSDFREPSLRVEESVDDSHRVQDVGSLNRTNIHGESEGFTEQIRAELNDIEDMLERDGGSNHWLVDSTAFSASVGVLVILNTLQMGAECQWPKFETAWVVCESSFTALFLVEMVVKVACLGLTYVFDGQNLLDGFIVVTSVLDVWVLQSILGKGSDLQMLSILRVLRMARLVRVLRLIKHVEKLVVVIRGVIDAIATTFWVACVVVLAVYVCAIFCTEYVGRGTGDLYPGYTEASEDIATQEIMSNFNPYLAFGNLPNSMLTLLNIAMMAEWAEVIRPVAYYQPHMTPFFILFVMFVTFGVMNVMVGMIVDNVFKEGTRLQDEEEMMEKKRKLGVLNKLRELLFRIDINGDKVVSVDELSTVLNSKNGADQACLKENLKRVKVPDGLTPTELLCMLDNDGDGKLEYDEFVRSFYRLIESNDFQRVCLLQVGINHVKNLVKVSRDEANTRMENLEIEIQDLGDEIRQACGTTRKHSRAVMAKEEKDGNVSLRDDLAGLIQDAQKSVEHRIMGLEIDFEAIGKEIRAQKITALSKDARWEKQDDRNLQDACDTAIHPSLKKEEALFSKVLVVEVPPEAPQMTAHKEVKQPHVLPSAGTEPAPEILALRPEASGHVAAPSISKYLDAVVRNVGHKVKRQLCDQMSGGCLDGYAAHQVSANASGSYLQLQQAGAALGNNMTTADSESRLAAQIGPHRANPDSCRISIQETGVQAPTSDEHGAAEGEPFLAAMSIGRKSTSLDDLYTYEVCFDETTKTLGIRLKPWEHDATERPEIESVYEASDAQRRGMRAGDVIVACNGVPTIGHTYEEVLSQLKMLRPLHVEMQSRHEPHVDALSPLSDESHTCPTNTHPVQIGLAQLEPTHQQLPQQRAIRSGDAPTLHYSATSAYSATAYHSRDVGACGSALEIPQRRDLF